MKALYVFQRIFHYVALWAMILAAIAAGLAVMFLGVGHATNANLAEAGALAYYLGLGVMSLAGLAILSLAVSHIFRMARKLAAKKREAKEECCCCCECECEREPSDLDAQVEEVMKWKNLYVEGIITEREFIDKRNEILGLSK